MVAPSKPAHNATEVHLFSKTRTAINLSHKIPNFASIRSTVVQAPFVVELFQQEGVNASATPYVRGEARQSVSSAQLCFATADVCEVGCKARMRNTHNTLEAATCIDKDSNETTFRCSQKGVEKKLGLANQSIAPQCKTTRAKVEPVHFALSLHHSLK